MSSYFSARLIVGVRLADVYDERIVESTVTKFDKDTGAPYDIKIKRLARKFLDQPLSMIDMQQHTSAALPLYVDGQPVLLAEKWLPIERDWRFLPKPMQCYFANDIANEVGPSVMLDGVVGVLACTTNSHEGPHTVEFDVTAVRAGKLTVLSALRGAGLKTTELSIDAVRVFLQSCAVN